MYNVQVYVVEEKCMHHMFRQAWDEAKNSAKKQGGMLCAQIFWIISEYSRIFPLAKLLSSALTQVHANEVPQNYLGESQELLLTCENEGPHELDLIKNVMQRKCQWLILTNKIQSKKSSPTNWQAETKTNKVFSSSRKNGGPWN